MYPNAKYIFTADESARLMLVNNSLPDIGLTVDEFFLLPFTRRQVRALITNWFGHPVDGTSLVLDEVLRLTARLQLPRSPFLMSMVLWLSERKLAFSPVNYATLIENFIDGLLEKLKDSNFRSEIYTFRIKQHFLCELAARLSENPKKSISRLGLDDFAIQYFKARPQPNAKPLELLEHFFRRGMLFEVGEDARFKLECFREYFVAKRMLENMPYLEQCTSESNFLEFANELDYYSGLKQDDIGLLRLTGTRLEAAYRETDLNIYSRDYLRLVSHEDSLMLSMKDRISDLILSRPDNAQREQMLDDFDEIDVHKKVIAAEDAVTDHPARGDVTHVR